ncbi:MAG: ribonuclease P protein component [Porticoccus sp.]|jgi:ribonuclease P protein component
MPEATFCRNKRLLTARAYQAVFAGACFKVSHPHLLLLARPNQLSHPRLGLVVAKKHIRHAVNRNRVKRFVRETFRLAQQQLDSLDVVFLSRPGMDKLSPKEQTELLENSWRRLSRKLQLDQHAKTD